MFRPFLLCPYCQSPLDPSTFYDHAFEKHSTCATQSHVCPICVMFYGLNASSASSLSANLLTHLHDQHPEMQGAARRASQTGSLHDNFARFVVQPLQPCPGECPICLGDFEVNHSVVRMECFCVFHDACISLWWAKKKHVMCPTHMFDDE